MVETGECGDVGTGVWPHTDGTHALAELRYGIVAHQHESGFKYGHNFAHTLHGASGVKLYPGSANAHDRRNGGPGVQ